MSFQTPPTSARLQRAAAAERDELLKRQERLLARRDELHAELADLEDALAGARQRLGLLERLAPSATTVDVRVGTVESNRSVLRGPAIREVAVQLLRDHPEGRGPVHYRRVLELLEASGYAIEGKNPPAVLLTQLSRSPVIRKTTHAGTYELDAHAPARLRREIARVQDELRHVTGAGTQTVDLEAVRADRDRLLRDLRRLEREAAEADAALGSASTDDAARRA